MLDLQSRLVYLLWSDLVFSQYDLQGVIPSCACRYAAKTQSLIFLWPDTVEIRELPVLLSDFASGYVIFFPLMNLALLLHESP